MTVTWLGGDKVDGGWLAGVPLEVEYFAYANYQIQPGVYRPEFDGVALPEDLLVEVEVVSVP